MPSHHTKKGRSKGGGGFVCLRHFMMDSPAWLSLGTGARAIYLEILRRYNGRNNGYLALSVRDGAERCRLNKDTVTRVIGELCEKGFVEVAVPGAFSCKVRHAAEYRLTVERCDRTGTPPSKAFMKWRPEQPQKSKGRSGMRPRQSP